MTVQYVDMETGLIWSFYGMDESDPPGKMDVRRGTLTVTVFLLPDASRTYLGMSNDLGKAREAANVEGVEVEICYDRLGFKTKIAEEYIELTMSEEGVEWVHVELPHVRELKVEE